MRAHRAVLHFRRSAMSSSQRNEGAFGHGLNARHTSAHARRRASTHAAFLLRRLSPGMRLLDCGCGPGSITTGLAEAVAPGITVGIDVQSAVLPLSGGATDARLVRYAAGDVYALPLRRRHVRRGVRPRNAAAPGGTRARAARDAARAEVRWHDRRRGRRLRRKPDRAGRRASSRRRCGCSRSSVPEAAWAMRTSASICERYCSTRDSCAPKHRPAPTRTAPTMMCGAQATSGRGTSSRRSFSAGWRSAGLATGAEMRAFAGGWARWGAEPGAFWATFWCEAIAWK